MSVQNERWKYIWFLIVFIVCLWMCVLINTTTRLVITFFCRCENIIKDKRTFCTCDFDFYFIEFSSFPPFFPHSQVCVCVCESLNHLLFVEDFVCFLPHSLQPAARWGLPSQRKGCSNVNWFSSRAAKEKPEENRLCLSSLSIIHFSLFTTKRLYYYYYSISRI